MKPTPVGIGIAKNVFQVPAWMSKRAIWLAVQQPGKPVAVKSEMQQAMLSLHRMRSQLVKVRTMQANGLRGILAEYGEVAGQGRASLSKTLPELLGRLSERLPAVLIESLREQSKQKPAQTGGVHINVTNRHLNQPMVLPRPSVGQVTADPGVRRPSSACVCRADYCSDF